jgi:hypothetical protein
VEIIGNHIHQMDNSGISTTRASSDPDNGLGEIEAVTIVHNRIIDCVRMEPNAFFEAQAVGGIVLREVSQIQIHRNDIVGNGAERQVPACGIFTYACQGLEVTDNRIIDNGAIQTRQIECIDFTTMEVGTGPNPRIEQSVSFLVRDFNGNVANETQISNFGEFTGLNCNFQTEVSLRTPSSSVELRLVHFATPATIEAFNEDGSSAGTATMTGQGQAETFVFNGTAISRVVIDAPQNETLLLEFCPEARETQRECIDFTTMEPDTGPNPRIEQGVSFLARDFNGNVANETTISDFGDFTGLNCNFQTEVSLSTPSSSVELRLVHSALPATIEAFNTDGSSAGIATMSEEGGQAETFTFSGTAINRVVIDAPQNEVLLLEFCFGREEVSYQAGIVSLFATGGVPPVEGQTRFQTSTPAIRIHDNIVVCPKGRTLIVIATGPVSVIDNALTSHAIRDEPDPLSQLPQMARFAEEGQCVLIINLGRTPVLADAIPGFGINTGIHLERAGTLDSANLRVVPAATLSPFPDGRTLFHDNQVTLQIVDNAPDLTQSSAAIVSLDDVSLQDNQILTEIAGGLVQNSVSVLAFTTIRASGNRFTELPQQAIFSYFSWAQMNVTTGNQATHCIVTGGAQIIEENNQELLTTNCGQLTAALTPIIRG